MKYPFGTLQIGDTARHYIRQAMKANWVSEGANVREFERRFAEKFGYKHAIATSSGTDACMCACAALYDLDAKRGDEIIVPALTFAATANATLAAGFVPKFVDIELETLNIDPSKIEAAITPKTKAIFPVHLMGKLCRMEEILAIAEENSLIVIEDACEAVGALQDVGTPQGHRMVGTFGEMACFSFYAAHLIVCGEGGMVVTQDDAIADILHSVHSHGRPAGRNFFDFQRIGFNSKMTDLEAAIGLEGLERFDDTFKKRKKNLRDLLAVTKSLKTYCYFLREDIHEIISPHAFPLVLKDPKWNRDKLYAYLEEHGIECKTLFGSLPTQHKAFSFLGYKLGDFPVAEYVGENGLHFGIGQYLKPYDIADIAETLKEYFK